MGFHASLEQADHLCTGYDALVYLECSQTSKKVVRQSHRDQGVVGQRWGCLGCLTSSEQRCAALAGNRLLSGLSSTESADRCLCHQIEPLGTWHRCGRF